MRSDGGTRLADASAGASNAAISELSERELVDRLRQHLPPPPAWMIVGIGDDAAVIEPERNRLEVVTVDAIVEGVHFDRRFTPPEAIGHRALAVNLSDLASMGATPRFALLSFVLPSSLSLGDFDGIVSGIAALAAQERVHVAGGNLARSPGPIVIDITVAGAVKRRGTLTRSAARPGDELFVSGSVGAAAAGLDRLKMANDTRDPADTDDPLTRAYLFPRPRTRLGMIVGRNRAASACMDLSDGLADAIHQIAGASGVGAVVDRDAIPVEPAARAWFDERRLDPVTASVAGGDDYELLFAVRPRSRKRFEAAARAAGAAVTKIGACTPERAVVLRCGGVETPLPRGYHHFR